jgi:hypothetical protein
MKNVAATTKAKEVKAAAKKVAAKGVKPYKHEGTTTGRSSSAESNTEEVGRADQFEAGEIKNPPTPASPFGAFAISQLTARTGVDSRPAGVVESGFPSTNQESTMEATKTKQELDAEKAKAKIAAKAEKQAAADKKKADALAEREAKIKARDEAAAKRKAEREAAIAAHAAANPPGEGRERTYLGPMLALSDRVKSGAYVKGLNGQLRSTDEVAMLFDPVPAAKTVPLLLAIFQTVVNEYAAKGLNYGQQSMNLRNKLRGALRKGLEVNGTKLTIDYCKSVRDDGGFATAEADAAEKVAKKVKAPKVEEAVAAA